jgi:hypothetical protein
MHARTRNTLPWPGLSLREEGVHTPALGTGIYPGPNELGEHIKQSSEHQTYLGKSLLSV